jgi:hypothetical protein
MVSQASLLVAVGLAVTAIGGVAIAFGGGFLTDSGNINETAVPADNGSLKNLSATNASFQYTVDSVKECGLTCRNATGTLTNSGTEAANNITIRTRIFADGDLLWNGTSEIGELAAEERYTDNKKIKLSFAAGQKARSNGQVTIETIVEFDEGTDVFRSVHEVN